MKTKNKILAVAEIAIVLCSMLLVALPAIAAASELYEPGPLDVFGNANEDDTIDMRDTTYIKLVIFGKKPETKLADANYDGKISMLDVGQTKLIVLGKEKKLTFIDIFGEAETVNKPIERLAHLGWRGLEMTQALGARDIVVCTGLQLILNVPDFYPELSKLPIVGYKPDEVDYEMVLSLKPDAVMTNLEAKFWVLRDGLEEKRMFEEKLPGMPLICLNMREQDVLPENVRTYGYIIDREDEAEEFIGWFEGYLNLFKSRTEGLSEDEKPKAFFENTPYYCYPSGTRVGQVIVNAGGKNILDETIGPDHPMYGGRVDVDPEFVVMQNPDFFFRAGGSSTSGYATDDPTKMAETRQQALDRPELANLNAVKNKQVYSLSFWVLSGAGDNIIGTAYLAKLFHPDLFADIDPQAIHQEYRDNFDRDIDYNIKEQGVFVWPPYEEWPV